ncbi:MAG TPA: Fe-S cluster assembly protein SufB [Nitrososphaeraceae archaeon]|jgi:Fe-S cluster assembly protein SufB|nr:Fe-S cluster assembly protein SufB [Nitrososphaeraceae archaeon]
MTTEELNMDYSKYDFKDSTDLYVYTSKKGLSRGTVEEISKIKNEPQWMLDFRLRSYDIFMNKPMPVWGGDLSKINFQNIYYYTKASEKQSKSWDDVPESVRKTFDKLGIPEAEKKFLAGVGAQYESETVYHNLREDLSKQGVIFCDTDTAVKEHPDLLKKYFGKVIPPEDNKFAALNSAVWSGGSFIYVPPNVKVDLPLQAYFRINAENIGQFERTLIIADEGSEVHYIEGCTAPVYTTESLHSAVVELIAKKGAKIRYTTIQNWSKDVYNLVTKRAYAYENARVEWVDGNLGSKLTMKYPGVYMLGRNAHAEVISIAFAGSDQHQDAGAKAVHLAPDTTSRITSKSVSKQSGRTTYRGLLHVAKGATNVKSNVRCDALLLDETSRTDTYPYVEVNEDDATISHEASVGKIGEDQIFYLMSRGFSESDALSLIVGGFIEPFTKELPMEYAVELNRLVKLEMEGSVG